MSLKVSKSTTEVAHFYAYVLALASRFAFSVQTYFKQVDLATLAR